MGRIQNEELYPRDTDVNDQDNLFGTDGNVPATNKNFNMKDVREFIANGYTGAVDVNGTILTFQDGLLKSVV